MEEIWREDGVCVCAALQEDKKKEESDVKMTR